MGETSLVANHDRLIHDTSKGDGIGRECPGHWPGNRSNLLLDILARLGKGWRRWGNPYPGTGMVVRLGLRVGTVVHLCRVWDGIIRLFLLSIPMVVLMMKLDDDMAYLWWSLTLLSLTLLLMFNYESWAYHSFNEPYAFIQLYKCLLIPLHPPDIYMLEWSPASMQCTHGAVVKLFCR